MRYLLWSVCLASLLIGVTIVSRPVLPIDETRYLSVAWEAHFRGDYLVSHLNGHPYSHKPPLLFWLINAVWFLSDVGGPAARLVSPVAGIMCLVLTQTITRRLWPASTTTINCAPLVHVALLLWTCFCSVTMFDTLLTCCTMTALLGVLLAADGRFTSGWLLAGFSLGLGILTKGPVILVHALPAAVMAPWWAPQIRTRLVRWYAGLGSAIVLAATIGLSWAIPSAIAGGEPYYSELLFSQTAGRMVNSFAHREPFWWYIPVLPLCLTPWILSGAVWRGRGMTSLDAGLKFLLCWAGGSLLILSLVSGKQVYYLLPMLPACSIILTRFIVCSGATFTRRDVLPIAIGTVLLGLAPLPFNNVPQLSSLRLSGIITDPYVLPLIACGLLLLVTPRWQTAERLVLSIAASSIVFMSIVTGSISGTLWRDFDLKPLADFVKQCDKPVAWLGDYHGQLNYLGQISSVDHVYDGDELKDWVKANPDGAVVVRIRPSSAAWADLLQPLSESDRKAPQEKLQQEISELLSNNSQFPQAEFKPMALYVQRFRRGLTFDVAVVVSYRAIEE